MNRFLLPAFLFLLATHGLTAGTVTNTNDSGAGSLRVEISSATAGDTVTFDTSLSGMTITLGGTQLIIDKNLTIDASALPGGITIDGNNASRVIGITSGNVVALDSLTITGGNAIGLSGGGIRVDDSSLTVRNSTIVGNSSDNRGGGLFSNTTLTGLTTSLINCTVTNNTATNSGGGIHNDDGKTILTHCTITGNTAPAGFGSGVSSFGDTFTETEAFSTIISGNTNSDVDFVFDPTNNFTSVDANLIGTGNATGNFNQTKDQVGITDPQLAPLGNYGGPTQTMHPRSGSVAINSAATLGSSPATDQRGFTRAIGDPDIGAVETGNIIPGFTPVVTSTGDTFDGLNQNGVCLREAIEFAPSGATVTFDAALSGNTITLGGTELIIYRDLTLDASALPDGITVSGNDASRVFYILFETVVMDSVSVMGGRVSDDGAGIYIKDANLTFRNGTISGNNADGTDSEGGGIYNVHGTLTIEKSTISGNVADISGGISNRFSSSNATLTNVTITGNTARSTGGGVANSNDASITLIHCTISGNSAIDVVNGYGGGIYFGSGTLAIENSIVAGNTAGTGDPDIAKYGGTLTVTGNNLIGDNSSVETEFPAPASPGTANTNGDFVGTSATPLDPLLAPLGNYGGPTQTMYPQSGSVAFNNAVTLPSSPATDQRGFARYAGTSDIGAVERGRDIPGFTPVVTSTGDTFDGLDQNGVSLREAIELAPSGTTINFDASLSGTTITLGGSELVISKDLTLDASALADGITVSGNDASGVFTITGTVVMDSVSVTGGRVSADGAGIHCNSANLTFRNGTISGNTADGANSDGGGIFNAHSSLTIENSTISGNVADNGGGIDNRFASASATLTNVTITGNTSRNFGGGIDNGSNASLTLNHCTISGNSSIGLLNGRGGGMVFGSGTVAIENSIIAGNTAGAGDPDIAKYGGTLTVTGNNLIGDNSTVATEFPAPASPGTANTNGDYVGTSASPLDPLLAPLGNYGGPTQTMHPQSDSVAINNAVTLGSSPASDQRGFARYAGISGIGAVETDNTIPGFTPVVTSTGDTFDGLDQNGVSLREAIKFAPSGTTVTFDAALSGTTITLGGTELAIYKDLTLDASALPDGITVSGNNASRVFLILNGTVVMDSISVTGGRVSGYGAGIHCNSTNLTFRNGTISGNTADGVNSDGGGIFNIGGSLTIENSTISGNEADNGGGIYNSSASASATLTNVTITGNTARRVGGGVANSHDASLTLIHCTISGNSANDVLNGRGGGIYSHSGTLAIENTIVAGNTAAPGDPDIAKYGGTLTATGNNLIGDNTTVGTEFPAPASPGTANTNGDYIGTTASPLGPLLAPLGNYGGPTLTLRPLPTSLALDNAVTLGTSPSTDQRGVSRPQSAVSDIGAFEVLAPAGFVDSDGDDMDDRLEPLYGFTVGVQDGHLDADNDGSTNAAELGNVTDPLDSSSLLRIMSMTPATGFHPTTNPVFEITINTFPGLSYRLETSNTLTGFTDMPGSTFTATGFSEVLNVTLGANGDFVRAQRD